MILYPFLLRVSASNNLPGDHALILVSPAYQDDKRRAIRPQKDHVRIYYLCVECVGRTETTMGKEVLSGKPAAIVVG